MRRGAADFPSGKRRGWVLSTHLFPRAAAGFKTYPAFWVRLKYIEMHIAEDNNTQFEPHYPNRAGGGEENNEESHIFIVKKC
jgi:hypothetical protein